MSIVSDQIRRVDSQLDRVHLTPRKSQDGALSAQSQTVSYSPRITELQRLVKALSTSSSSASILSSWRILQLLNQAALSDVSVKEGKLRATATYERELEWLLISKATVQTYGVLLNTLLEQTIPLTDDIWYWDEVLGSYTYSGLYMAQTSPLRFWSWAKDIYRDTKHRIERLRDSHEGTMSTLNVSISLTDRWKQFYSLVRESIQERSVVDLQRRILSPIAQSRSEARRNQARLRRLRELGASGIGVLMDEGLKFDFDEEKAELAKSDDDETQEWKVVVERSVALMHTVFCNVTSLEIGVTDFEDVVFASVEEDPELPTNGADESPATRPAKLANRLQQILQVLVPKHVTTSRKIASEYGRPSRIVRYWLPATALLLSSATILRIFINRKAQIISWFRDFGNTIRDFWMNWVIEPTRKVIGTIRHDKDSEVAIMSKESLKGDRESLQRMVVEFALDNPEAAQLGSGTLNAEQVAALQAKVREGDLTPVLRAYEKDLRKPFVGIVRGDLIRTLLIQIQKTKVDVEVALSGIDALLKSQELVFGFVGLTPGVLVCFAAFSYFGRIFGSRRGMKQGRRAGQTVRILRNIDRILTLATPTANSLLSYKDHGLLLCEVHLLRARAHEIFPGEIEREFLEDVGDLCNINSGIQIQFKVLERIRWGYGKWLR